MRQASTWLGQIEPDKPSILALHINNYYLLSPSTLFFFPFRFCTSIVLHISLFCTFYSIAHFILISLFLPYICSCGVLLLYHFLFFCTVL